MKKIHKSRYIVQHLIKHENSILALIFVVLIAFFNIVTGGKVATAFNIKTIMLTSAVRGVISIGEAFVILSGNIDVSVGGLALFILNFGASLMTGTQAYQLVGHQVPVAAAIPLMLLAAVGIGIVNGSLVSRIGVSALVVTLAIWQITLAAAFQVSKGAPLRGFPPSLAFFGSGQVGGIYVPIIIFIVVSAVAYFVLNHTTFGHSVYAVGGNPTSAWISGIKVNKIVFTVFIISALLAGLGGLMLLSRVMIAGQGISGLEIDAIAAVSIGGISLMGGRGNIIGVILGVMIIGVIDNGQNILLVPMGTQNIIKSAIIIIAVAVDYLRRR
ncbi:ABC transporter permease [Chloroflexota bacterium]